MTLKGSTMRNSLDRMILAVYLIALITLLLAPVTVDGRYQLLNIGGDKWVHFGLFSGLAGLFRWNLPKSRRPLLFAFVATFAVSVFTELAQSVTSYRSASLGDLGADLIGGLVGVLVMSRIMSRPRPERTVGAIVTLLGLGIGALFVLADVIGVGTTQTFGPTQMTGSFLGALIAFGGIGIYVMGRIAGSRTV